MKTIYIHIGYPKCLSTTIQRGYFEQNSEISYGGIGIGNNITYSNDTVELIFESLLKYANDIYWNKNKFEIREKLRKYIAACSEKVVFSSEYLSMPFTLQEIPNSLKYKRLLFLFQDYDIKILIINRNIISFIKSLYKEYVRLGYFGEYRDFLRWIIIFRDRNFLYDLNYQIKNEELSNYFGQSNLTWLKFEDLKATGIEESLNIHLSKWLNIANNRLPIKNENPSLTDQEVSNLRRINENFRRGLGFSQTETFERHRARILFETSGLKFTNEELFSNVIERRNALNKLSELPKKDSVFSSNKISNLEADLINMVENIKDKS